MEDQYDKEMALELKKTIAADAKIFPTLNDYDADWLYRQFSKICRYENKPVTVENMMRYAPILESDLYREFNSWKG